MIPTCLCLALAVLISPVAALAQSTTSGNTGSTLQITSRIVYVDVVARDGNGQVARGLTAKDFRVFEDGKPQTVAYFADHTRDFSMPPAPASGLDFSNVGPVTNSVNIILFDFANTPVQDQPYARKQMIRFLENLPPGHQTALFVLGNRLNMLQNFTGNTDRLIAAAKAMNPGASTTGTTGEQQQDTDFVAAFEAAMGASASGQNAVRDGLNLERGEEMQHAADVTQAALSQIAAEVSGYPGRKNLYWLADRFPLYGGPALEIHELADDITGSRTNSQGIPGIVSTQDIAGANQGLANAQIAIYPILLTGVDASGMGAEARGMTGTQQLFTERTALHDMMDNLAYTTGGHAYYGTNDFAGALKNGFDDGSSYYTLAYIPQNGKWNGAFRKIKVELAQKGYSLSYRRGYYAAPETTAKQDPAQELNVALQPAAPETTMLRLSGSLVLPDHQNPYLIVKTAVNPDGLDLTTDSKGIRHGRLLVLLVALNQSGTQPDAPPQSSGVLNLAFTPNQYQTILKTGIQFGLRMKLKPGSYRLRLGVSDMNTNRLGTLDMPVTVQ